jgi:hypothetical protein
MAKIIEHNATTNEIVEREMNADELAQMAKDNADVAAKAEAKTQETTQKAALLAKLGITDDEAKLLLS